MAIANLNKEGLEINDGLESIVIVNCLGDIPGGRTLDVTAVADDVNAIKAGHILVINDTTKEVSPLEVTSGAYGTPASGTSYLGVLKASVLKKAPMAAIMTIGQVNAAASPYPVTDAIKAGLPNIQFIY